MRLAHPFHRWRHIFEMSFPDLDRYGSIYKDLHQHPELSCQESRTAALVAAHLESLGFEVQTGIGGHGVIGIFRNGKGKTVLLRSELDALPIKEETGLSYASSVRQVDADGVEKWVMHACGHDMHMASLLGASDLLRKVKASWSGTLLCVFQPAEERLIGARAMIDDGLFEKIPRPDIVLAQHADTLRAGAIATRPGPVLASRDSLDIRVFGKGVHSSAPERGIDPILMASCIVSRLQSVVSREIAPSEPCVVTCGSFHAGTAANIIPDHADFKVDIRSYSEQVRVAAVSAVKRIIVAECQASNSPRSPSILTTASCPSVVNDCEATATLTDALREFYGDRAGEVVLPQGRDMGADDFVHLGNPPGQAPIPSIHWNLGVTPREDYDKAEREGTLHDLPYGHSTKFAAEIEPSLRAGIEGLAIASVVFFER